MSKKNKADSIGIVLLKLRNCKNFEDWENILRSSKANELAEASKLLTSDEKQDLNRAIAR